MSSSRKLSERIDWDEKTRAMELLDWETRADHFDALCEHIIERFFERDQITLTELFSKLPEPEFRRHVRTFAERFTEKCYSIVAYIYFGIKYRVLRGRK